MKRRDLIKRLAVLPFAGAAGASSLGGCAPRATVSSSLAEDLIAEIGVVPIINARGGWSFLGGVHMVPEAMEAINATSFTYFNLHELNDRVGERIAEMLEVEAAMVTSGAACGMLVGTAGILTGLDQAKIDLLPELPGPRKEVIIQKAHRNRYVHAVRTTGVKMVEVETVSDVEQAVNANTVMMFFLHDQRNDGEIDAEQWVALAKRYNLPTMVDGAGLGGDGLFTYQRLGYDLVTVSGGKALRGPQSAGLLYGRRDLIAAARLNHSPNEAPIGRPAKLDRGEIFGMYAALKAHLYGTRETDQQEEIARAARIAEEIRTVPTVTIEGEGTSAWLTIDWDQSRVRITHRELYTTLITGTPRIELTGFHPDILRPELQAWTPEMVERYGVSDSFLEWTGHREGDIEQTRLTVITLKPEEDAIVARRVREVLQSAVV